jgi:hypothetical protein
MMNFAVDVLDTTGAIRHRSWFKTRSEAVAAANLRQLALPVEPTDTISVYELTEFHHVSPPGQECWDEDGEPDYHHPDGGTA